MTFETSLEIRIGDINYGRHLGHDALVTLLHQARMAWLRAAGLGDESGLIMRHLEVRYCAEAFLGEQLRIVVRAAEVKKARFVLHYDVFRAETLIAKASTEMVAFDYALRRVVALSPELYAAALAIAEEGA